MHEILAAKVAAQNAVHAEANRLMPLVEAAVKGLVGQKIQNVGGELNKAALKALPQLPSRPGLHAWYNAERCGLYMHVKACAPVDEDFVEYAEICLIVGVIHDRVVEREVGASVLRTDWTVEELLRLSFVVKAAQEAYERARRALGPFAH